MKKTTHIFFFLIVNSIVFGQQLPQYTQWSFHQMVMNPAHAGIKNCVEIHSIFRTQWVGFEGAPKSGVLTFSSPIKTKRKQYLSARHGMGFRFETDRIGQFTTNRVNLAYAGHFNFDKTNRLSLGLYGGIIQMGYNPNGSVTTVPDPVVSQEGSFLAPDASFGAWWNGENYYFGLMFQQLITSEWPTIGSSSKFRLHPTVNMGYRMKVSEKITFLPSFMLKVPPRGPLAMDLNLMLDFSNRFVTGLGYRNTDALMVFAGFKLSPRFTIHYSFDFTLSDIQQVSSNTHEFSLIFNTCKKENTSTSSCPLF
jgi:type IX secretion system PorP/SprF family membrane protein